MMWLAQCRWCHEMMVTAERNYQANQITKTPIDTVKIPHKRRYLLDLCSSCIDALPRIQNPCCQCAMPMHISPNTLSGERQTITSAPRCGRCQTSPPDYDYCYAAHHYQSPISNWIKQVKDRGQIAVTLRLEQLLQRFLHTISLQPDLVIAVPTLGRRLFRRNCNLSELLALVAAKSFVCRLITSVIKLENTSAQRGKSRVSRRMNSQNKFALQIHHPTFHDQHVLIVDDVMATGATAAALAKQLKQAGARVVGVLVLARAT